MTYRNPEIVGADKNKGRDRRGFMNHRHVKLDLNAKITDLAVSIEIEDGIPYAEVKFRNISPKTLTEIRFIARGFGADGEVLPVEDKDRFILVMQDLSVPAFGEAAGLRAGLPREDIRQVELGLLEYSFSDGTREKYEGADWIEYDIDEFDPDDEKEAMILGALRKRYPEAVCRPAQLENGWICLCGTYNADGAIRCVHCGAAKEEVFSLTEESQPEKFAERPEESADEERGQREEPKVSLKKTPVTEAWQEPSKIQNGAANRPSEMKTEHKILFAVIAAAVVVALILLLYFTSPNRALPFRSGYYGTGGYNGYGYNYGNSYGQGYGQSYGSSYGSGGYDYHGNYDADSRSGRHHG